MTYDEIAEEREVLIGQGLDMPNMDDDYFDHDDQFDAFSCATGDYRASTITDGSVVVKVESDLESYIDSDAETLCSDSEYTSAREFSTASTRTSRYPSCALDGNSPVIVNPVGVNNEHEGMNYDLLADGPESYDFQETIIQNGNLYLLLITFFIVFSST